MLNGIVQYVYDIVLVKLLSVNKYFALIDSI